jgi:hypothetical protein
MVRLRRCSRSRTVSSALGQVFQVDGTLTAAVAVLYRVVYTTPLRVSDRSCLSAFSNVCARAYKILDDSENSSASKNGLVIVLPSSAHDLRKGTGTHLQPKGDSQDWHEDPVDLPH